MKHVGWTTILILLASTILLPLPCLANDDGRTIEVAHIGEGIDAYVELSSAEGRMKAVPYVKLSGPRVETLPLADGKKCAGISTKTSLPDGNRLIESVRESKEISFSRGSRLFREAKDALKNRKRPNAGSGKTEVMAKEASSDIRQ